jgi:hypothetical protein
LPTAATWLICGGNNEQHLWLGEGLQQASITVKQHGELQQLGLRAATTLCPETPDGGTDL